MAVPRRLRETADLLVVEDILDDEDGFDDEDEIEAFRELLLDALENDPDVKAAIRRLFPAPAAAKPKPRGGRRG